jgi:hypothetical protein
MPNEEGQRTDDTRMVIRTLAWYLHRGYPLEVHEPQCAGAKDRHATRGATSVSRVVIHGRSMRFGGSSLRRAWRTRQGSPRLRTEGRHA